MNPVLIAILAGLIGMFGWGIADFFAKRTIDKIGDLKTLIGAQAIGGVFLLILFILSGNSIPNVTLISLLYLFLLALGDAVLYLLLYRAFERGVVSIVSPIAASAAGMTVLVSFFLFHDRLTSQSLVGVVCIFFGILLTSTNFTQLRQNLMNKTHTQGIPEALIVMIGMGFWFPLWDRFLQNGDWLFWLTCLRITMSILLILFFYIRYPRTKLSDGYRSVMRFLPFVAILDALAYYGVSWGYGTTTQGTSIISVLANAYSAPTIVLMYFFLKERITKSQTIGILLILSGIIISSIH